MMRAILSRFRRFARDDRGAVVAEAIVILPLLLWAYVALFVYWDAYRAQNTAVKASYTVADMISRELNPVSCTYMTGLKSVFDYLMDNDQTTQMIVSSVTWDPVDKRHEVQWSLARGGALPLNDGTIQPHRDKLPKMSDGDTVVLVQTSVDYKPSFSVGVPEYDFRQFIVTRPRRAASGISTTCMS